MSNESCIGEFELHQECRLCKVQSACRKKYNKLKAALREEVGTEPKDYKDYQLKAKKWDKWMELAKEEQEIDRRRKEIGQERAILLGLKPKYS